MLVEGATEGNAVDLPAVTLIPAGNDESSTVVDTNVSPDTL